MTKEMQPLRVLVVDDDEAVCRRLSGILAKSGYAVREAGSAEQAFEIADRHPLDAILLDIQLPGRSGLEALSEFSRSQPGIPVIMVTGHASLDGAIEAIRNQAFDYLIKPVSSSDLKFAMKRATRLRQLERENRSLRELVETTGAIDGIVAKSRSMSEVVSLIRRLAENESPVLIQGESGTGKDVVSRAIHLEGTRSTGPYVALNCAALPDSLLESELFGYARGAFTGAEQAKDGLFVKADAGTLFLDEIGEMPLAVQSKLLRVLQDGRVRPLGATEDFACNVRIIAASNRNIDQAIRDGQFRSDLYYRLSVIPIELEPLRRRVEDISPLAHMFAAKIDPERQFSSAAIEALEEHHWPGNVRELSNVVERSFALSPSLTLGVADLRIESQVVNDSGPEECIDPLEKELLESALDQNLSLKDLENAYIHRVLEKTSGNKSEAARILGINRATLYRRS